MHAHLDGIHAYLPKTGIVKQWARRVQKFKSGSAPFVDAIVKRTGEQARPFRWAAIEPPYRSTLATTPVLTRDGSEVTL